MHSETSGGFLISQIRHVGNRVFEKILADAGIDAFNGAQGRILYVLWQTETVPIVELSKRTGLAKTTLTSMLDRMETAGLLLRVDHRTDRRQTLIALTPKARGLQAEYERVSAQMNAIYYQGFSPEEILAVENYLLRILHNVNGGDPNA